MVYVAARYFVDLRAATASAFSGYTLPGLSANGLIFGLIKQFLVGWVTRCTLSRTFSKFGSMFEPSIAKVSYVTSNRLHSERHAVRACTSYALGTFNTPTLRLPCAVQRSPQDTAPDQYCLVLALLVAYMYPLLQHATRSMDRTHRRL